MDRRTKILTTVFGVVIAYLVLAQAVYPQWIRPALTLGDRIADREKTLKELEREEDLVQRAKADYLEFIERDGSLDASKVEIELRTRLNTLLAKHGLTGSSIGTGRSMRDAKTGVERVSLDVTAEAPLAAMISFLKDAFELPQLVRIGNVKLAKAGGSRGTRDADRVTLTMPFELLVPPAQKIAGPIDESKLKPHESFVRHLGRPYSAIWERNPFKEYEPPRPMSITMKPKTVAPKVGNNVNLQATVAGGYPEYTYAWSPPEGLSDPGIPNPKVDTAAAGTKVYTLTVTDARGQTVSESVTVNVTEPSTVAKAPVEEPPRTPAKPIPQPWPDGRSMQLSMIWTMFDGSKRTDELVVQNQKSRSADYYKVGDEFDGGKLVFLHQRGAVVRRNDEYWLYPIGSTLDTAVCERDGAGYPELQSAAQRHREAQKPPATAPVPLPDAGRSGDAGPAERNDAVAEMVGPPSPTETGRGVPKLGTPLSAPSATAPAGPPDALQPSGSGVLPPEAANARARAKQRAGNMTAGKPTPPRRGTAGSTPTPGEETRGAPEKTIEKPAPPVPE